MAESFFLAAWTAGIIEGASLLSHDKTKGEGKSAIEGKSCVDDEKFGLSNFLLPSIAYGTAAMPMSIIGESPGPAVVAFFPNFPPSTTRTINRPNSNHVRPAGEQLRRSEMMGMNPPSLRSRQSSTISKEHSERDGNEPNVAARTTACDNRHVPMLHRVRMENRMALEAARKQHKHQLRQQATAATSMASASPSPRENLFSSRRSTAARFAATSTQTPFTRYFATLDGKAVSLATPLAESMRRFRILLVGAGIVSLYWQKQLHEQQQRAPNKTHLLLGESRQVNKDICLSKLAQVKNQASAGGGVVLRLVDSQERFQNITGRIPVLSSSGVFAGTPEADELPLSKEWLVRGKNSVTDKNKSFLVVEANVSSSFVKCFGNTSLWSPSPIWGTNEKRGEEDRELEKAMVASNRISIMARRKSLLTSDKVDEDGDSVTLVNVFIGSGPALSTPWISEHRDSTIYLDGLCALGAEISSLLTQPSMCQTQRVDKEQSQSDLLDATSSDAPNVESGVDENRDTDVFASLGQTIRQLIKTSTDTLGQATSTGKNGEKSVLRVVSDNPQFVGWLRNQALVDWNIQWLDPSDLKYNDEKIAKNDGGSNGTAATTLVCCQNEEKTFHATLSIASSLSTAAGGTGDLVALVETSRMEELLKQSTQDLHRIDDNSTSRSTVYVQSAETVYGNLFDNVQRLLSKGTSPDQIKDLAHSDPTYSTLSSQV